MLTEERHALILEKLAQDNVVKSQELMELLNCSESTVRRDLAQLEEQGKLIRIHGGAKRFHTLQEEETATEKMFKNVQEKKAIAAYAASLIENGDTVYLDAGTTTQYMIPHLVGKTVRIITNGLPHAHFLADQQNDVLLIGGTVKLSTKAIVGSESIEQLSRYRFDKVFLGMNGLDLRYGCTTPDPDEAAVKREAVRNSIKCFVLADSSKFEHVTFAKVCDLDEVTVLTSGLPTSLSEHYSTITLLKEVTE
ncbi:DeoR/GlpR family DNA-binding transcription regulator [Pisciglobus halotolerans]|uniref:Transcriptional regulator, DeoR family n=1 Tax=Pisciglobus halotolerans TaxID=745365 RepID=A0A1I3AMW7_9LACT|nr:DeoR/GlpR family DNA-binding transcription regulator [Pisciglobus halotolerans]SFH51059.1 transcriptional regulator, DeoR family [Pisciglobus halotolerans]